MKSGVTRTWVMTITPFSRVGSAASGSGEELDEGALRQHLRRLADAGIGVCLGSYGSGEGRLLRRDEIRQLYRIGAEELSGRVPFAAAALGLTATERVIELATEALELGAEAVQIHPPLAGPPSIAPLPHEIDRFYDDVLCAVRGPVILSNEELMVGYSLAPERMLGLIDRFEQIVGIHWTDSNPATLGELMERVGQRVPVRVGLTAQLPLALALGAEGAVSFEANVAPGLCAAVTRAFDVGDHGEFQRLFQRLGLLNRVLLRHMTPRSVKAALAYLGQSGSELRRPYLALDAASQAALVRDLEELCFTPGSEETR